MKCKYNWSFHKYPLPAVPYSLLWNMVKCKAANLCSLSLAQIGGDGSVTSSVCDVTGQCCHFQGRAQTDRHYHFFLYLLIHMTCFSSCQSVRLLSFSFSHSEERLSIPSFLHSFNRLLLNTFYLPDTLLFYHIEHALLEIFLNIPYKFIE